MSILAIVDEVAALLEPTAGARDTTAARPLQYQPGILYAWPVRERYVPEGDGSLDDMRFELRAAWATDVIDELTAMARDRSASQVIENKVGALAALIRGARTGAAYEHLQVDSVDYSLIADNVRGFYLDLSGYQLLS